MATKEAEFMTIKYKGIAKSGDVVVNTATLPAASRDHANMVKVSVVK